MFSKILSRNKKLFKLRRSPSVKNVALEGKIVISYCAGHNTIIIVFSLKDFKNNLLDYVVKLYHVDLYCEIFKNPRP